MSLGRLTNKTAIITGSSSGLGRAISLRYAREGAKVVCADLTTTARTHIPEERDNSTHEAIVRNGGEAIFVQTDASDGVQMENLVKRAVGVFGRLDVMVNNAGISLETRQSAPCHLTDESVWDTTMRINARSVFLGCKYAAAQMLKQEPHESGDRGWIVNMCSQMGLVGGKENTSYAASKAAVANLTRQVAIDYAEDRIHVNALCPGFTQTAIVKETIEHTVSKKDLERRIPFNRLGEVDDVAKMAVVFASDDASWVTGVLLPIDGGYTAQ